MALNFTITSPTTGLGAGTPSRAITITLTGSGTLGSTGSFALSDGSAGGSFFPASPVTIASGSGAGASTQFVYIPTPGASGTIVLTVTASGGLTASHTISLPMATNATVFAKDTFTGTLNADIGSRTPDIGGGYTRQFTTTSIGLLGSNTAGGATGSHEGYYIPAANTGEYDVQFDILFKDDTGQTILAAQCSSTLPPGLYGYLLTLSGGTWTLTGYVNSNPTTVFANLAVGTIATGNTYTPRLCFRVINLLQYIFFFVNDTLGNAAPYQDGSLTTGFPGIWSNGPSTLSTGQPIRNFQATNPDWSVAGPTSGVTFPDDNVFLSPAVWKVTGGTATMTGTYGYLKGVVTGTTAIKVNVDTSINSGQSAVNMPTLVLTLNYGVPTYHQFGTADTQVTLATGLNPAVSYSYKIECLHGNQAVGNSWTGTAAAVKLNALEFDGGAIFSPAALRSKRAVILGASGEQPYNGGTQGGGSYTTIVDGRKGWWVGVMQGYDAEFSVHGVGGCSFLNPGQAGYPVFGSWWDHLDSTTPRTWGTIDLLIVHVGENDQNTGHTSDQTRDACAAWLTAVRTALPATFIVLHLPWQATQTARTGILAAIAALNNNQVKALDPGLEFIASFTGSAGEVTDDGLHGNDRGYGILDGIMGQQLQFALGGSIFTTIGCGFIRGVN